VFRVIRMFSPGSFIPSSSLSCTISFYLYMSPVQLNWFIKSRVVCGLPVIHAPKRPLVIIQKEQGNHLNPGLPILVEVGITGPPMAPQPQLHESESQLKTVDINRVTYPGRLGPLRPSPGGPKGSNLAPGGTAPLKSNQT
jgi:hypothetical protein